MLSQEGREVYINPNHMKQFVNSTEEVIYCQIQTGSADVKIAPGEMVESGMRAEYLETLGLTALETKTAEGEVTKDTKAQKAEKALESKTVEVK